MTRVTLTVIIGLLSSVAGWTTAAHGQSVTPPLPARLGAAARAAITATIDSARTDGLPVRPLVDKAAEGVLKGADDGRIVAAVRSLAAAMRDARTTLGPDVDPSLLAAAASALRAGVTTRDLHELARSSAGGMPASDVFATALVTLVDFVSKGVPPGTAARSIHQLLRADAPASQFVRLRAEVDADVQSGQSPAAALDARVRDDLRTLDATPGETPPTTPHEPPGR